jgi:hypothetical protein
MKIRTTYVGSLPGPPGFNPLDRHEDDQLPGAVAWAVDRQREVGLDIINEGELTKGRDGNLTGAAVSNASSDQPVENHTPGL